jgi:cellulose synthase/poly-beta-1,6-N-acetylglucosamine synthase-like glycosyltransferase
MTYWMQFSFLFALGLILYTYIGFPMVVAVKAFFLPKAHAADEEHQPSVTVLIAAYNEASCIGEKLDRLFESNYPAELLQVIVVSDGSTDRTNAVVKKQDRVLLVELPRSGKAAALNAGAAHATGDVLVFTDANSMFARDAIAHLVAPLSDDAVGGVAGDQRYLKGGASTTESASSSGERSYWKVDRCLKELESRGGNTISATGAIYAIRRSLFRGAPEGVTDDFAISTDVIEQGFRLVFRGDAIAYEPVANSSQLEFGRKVRVMTRGFRSVWLRRALLNPFRHGFYSLQLFSHKVLRRIMVFPLAALTISSVLLWREHWFYQACAAAQVAFYATALLPLVVGRLRLPKTLALPFFFCMVNSASLIALARAIFGRRVTTWETHRGDVSGGNQTLSNSHSP